MASNGAAMSTIKVSAVLTLTIPITRSFLTGKYWTGKRIKVVAFVLVDTIGMPEYKDTKPD